MGKHYELKEEKALFLLKLWHREHGLELDDVTILSPEEAARYIREEKQRRQGASA